MVYWCTFNGVNYKLQNHKWCTFNGVYLTSEYFCHLLIHAAFYLVPLAESLISYLRAPKERLQLWEKVASDFYHNAEIPAENHRGPRAHAL